MSNNLLECAICLEQQTNPLKNDDMLTQYHKLQCQHSFHYKCIQLWIKSSTTCPMCRIHISTFDIDQILDPYKIQINLDIEQIINLELPDKFQIYDLFFMLAQKHPQIQSMEEKNRSSYINKLYMKMTSEEMSKWIDVRNELEDKIFQKKIQEPTFININIDISSVDTHNISVDFKKVTGYMLFVKAAMFNPTILNIAPRFKFKACAILWTNLDENKKQLWKNKEMSGPQPKKKTHHQIQIEKKIASINQNPNVDNRLKNWSLNFTKLDKIQS